MTCKGPQRDSEKERFWRNAIRQQRRSGQSVREYCRDKSLAEPSFYAWRREITQRSSQRAQKVQRRAAQRPAFVPVHVAPATVSIGSASIECVLPSGVMLRFPVGMEPSAIAALLTSWERSRC